MTKKREKGFRIVVGRDDVAKVLNTLVFDTNVESFSVCGRKVKIICVNQRDVYERMKKLLTENNIKFSTEE